MSFSSALCWNICNKDTLFIFIEVSVKILLFCLALSADVMFQFNYKDFNELQYNFVPMTLGDFPQEIISLVFCLHHW